MMNDKEIRYKCKNCGREVSLADPFCKCGDPINALNVARIEPPMPGKMSPRAAAMPSSDMNSNQPPVSGTESKATQAASKSVAGSKQPGASSSLEAMPDSKSGEMPVMEIRPVPERKSGSGQHTQQISRVRKSQRRHPVPEPKPGSEQHPVRKALTFTGILVGVFCISFLGARMLSSHIGNASSAETHEEDNQFTGRVDAPEGEASSEAVNDNTSADLVSDSEPTYVPTDTPTPEPTATPTPTPTPEPLPTPTPVPKHKYKIVFADVTWEEAQVRCLESSEKNAHLASFETASELEKVCQQISAEGKEKGRFFIGARRSSDNRNYYWVDRENSFFGDPINDNVSPIYGYWMRGEPSFEDSNQTPVVTEDKVDLCFFESENRYVINDVPNDVLAVVPGWAGRVGYILEYEEG